MRRKFPGIRKLLLVLVDIIIISLSAYVAVAIVANYGNVAIKWNMYMEMIPVMLVVALLLFNVNGLFSITRKTYSEVVIGLFMALLSLYVIMMALSFFMREFSYSRSILLVAIVLQFVLLAVWRYVYWRVDHVFMYPRNVMVLGNQAESERIVNRLQLQPHLRDYVKYVCTDSICEPWQDVIADIELVIICASLPLQQKSDIIDFCHVQHKQVFLVPDFYNLFCSSVDLDKIDDIPVFRPRYLRPTLEQRLLKRLFDIAFSLTALICGMPIFIVVMLAISISSSGPIFYTQVRNGLNEKEFKVYKFCTMFQDAEQLSGPVMASNNDTRITKVGRLLRATRLDELPQFINVLIGNMSIVGPRPERPFFVGKFKREMPEYVYRHNVKPGITGIAQIYGKYNTIPADKLIYDLIYIQKCNIITDINIILQTLRVLVSKSSTEGVGAGNGNGDLSMYSINDNNENDVSKKGKIEG